MMNSKNLILLGGGGHCKSIIDVAESAGYNILGVLDPNEPVGSSVLAYKVLGNDDLISEYADKADFVITVGQIKSCAIRKKLAERVEEAGGHFATIIASDAYVSKYATIGEGSVIMHKAFVNAGAKVGRNCIINTMVNLEHDVEVGDFCHVSTGTMVNGDCKIGAQVFIGSQSVLSNGVTLGDNIIVGAASYVRKSILVKGIYVGNPTDVPNRSINKSLMGGGKSLVFNNIHTLSCLRMTA